MLLKPSLNSYDFANKRTLFEASFDFVSLLIYYELGEFRFVAPLVTLPLLRAFLSSRRVRLSRS